MRSAVEPRATKVCALRHVESRPVDPAPRRAQAVQRAQHPKLAAGEVGGARIRLDDGHARRASRFDDEVHGDARDARQGTARPHERLAPPPEQPAVGALDDSAPGIHDDRLTSACRVSHGRAQGPESVEIGALDERPAARVVRRGRHVEVGRDRRGGAQPQAQLRAVGALTQLDARKPIARAGQSRDDVVPELGSVVAMRARARKKPLAMPLEPAHTAVDDAPRVGDKQATRLARVAPVEGDPGLRSTGAPRVQALVERAHTIEGMRPRVLEHPIAALPSAEALFLALAAEVAPHDGLVWLDSGLGARTGRSLIATGERVALDEAVPVLPQLRAALAELPAATADEPVQLGLVGWLGYELRGETMALPVPPVPGHHRAAWLRVDRGVALDHTTGSGRLVALDPSGTGQWNGELDAWRQRMLALVERAARASAPALAPAAPTNPIAWRDADAHYADLVRRCQRSIREGDAYQLCLTTQATVSTVDGSPLDAVEIYRRLRRSSPAHHGALLRIGGTTLLSASPETFLRVADGVVQTRPIKGTRPRDTDPQRDAALAAELAASDKEQAENLMIVDLMRNDLARISEVGSVVVTGLLEVESYAHVHQLVSTVEGRLRPGLDALDAVAACLPAGSMTGAPKRRAIELLAELEAGPRGIYSGAFGYLGADGTADLAMVIRSIVIDGARATIGAGGGVTALSEPIAEVAEMQLKAQALLRALAGDSAGSYPVI